MLRKFNSANLLNKCSGIIAEKTSNELFALDTTGSKDIQIEYNRRHKPLKVDEILAQRSAIPAVSSRKRLITKDGIIGLAILGAFAGAIQLWLRSASAGLKYVDCGSACREGVSLLQDRVMFYSAFGVIGLIYIFFFVYLIRRYRHQTVENT